jgi:hypothetical protein
MRFTFACQKLSGTNFLQYLKALISSGKSELEVLLPLKTCMPPPKLTDSGSKQIVGISLIVQTSNIISVFLSLTIVFTIIFFDFF